MSDHEIEIAEREALLADIERQISRQQQAIDSLRNSGRSTHQASLVLSELHQKADRQRDYLKVIRDGVVIAK
jgi:hypothetical protein